MAASQASTQSTTSNTTNNISDSYNRTLAYTNNISNSGNVSLGGTPDQLQSLTQNPASAWMIPITIIAIALLTFLIALRR